ncbi:MAG: GtrA family protein [Dysgonamonadaceae bacterium]|jgi:putative flippase GtrA|nr:GtrA family protein [Dysgonamonadaceae bacterium]
MTAFTLNKNFFTQFLKYGIVGVVNTLLTLTVIWIIMKWGYGMYGEQRTPNHAMLVSNLVGYGAGIISSFIFNRNWTFKSKGDWKKGFIKFVAVFAVCYIVQLGVVLILNKSAVIASFKFSFQNKEYFLTSSYICQLIGNVCYTILNFLCNKYYTFKNDVVKEAS